VGKAGREIAGIEKILNDRRLQRVAEELKGLVRNAIRVQAEPLDTDLPIGASRLGGRPDLPPDVAWPTGKAVFSPPTEAFRRDHPDDYYYYAPASGVVSLPFVAQINLSEATEFDRDHLLPKEGLLLFFYDARGFPSDTDISRRGCDEILADGRTYKYDIFHTEGRQAVLLIPADELSRREFPADLPAPVRYPQYGVRFSAEASLPNPGSAFIGSGLNTVDVPCAVVLTGPQLERYGELSDAVRADRLLCHLLGYGVELAGNSEHVYVSRERRRVAPQAAEWESLSKLQQRDELLQMWLLFEVENVQKEFPEERYGRQGRLYFYMLKEDLLHRRFDRVWTFVE
jgi:hypothetical protein